MKLNMNGMEMKFTGKQRDNERVVGEIVKKTEEKSNHFSIDSVFCDEKASL